MLFFKRKKEEEEQLGNIFCELIWDKKIKDKKEFAFKRFKSIIINTQNSGYNSIFVKANDNIILTGIGFFKNTRRSSVE